MKAITNYVFSNIFEQKRRQVQKWRISFEIGHILRRREKKLESVIAGWKDVNDYEEAMAEFDDNYSSTSSSLSSSSSKTSEEEELVEKLGLLG